MADKEEKKDEGAKGAKDEPKEQATQSGAKISILTWIIMAVVIVVMAGSGFVLGRLLAGSSATTTTTDPSQEKPQTEDIVPDSSDTGSKDTWYYNELESVVVNPDVPGATRYVRVGLILEMSSGLSENEATKLMGAKKPLLMNWLNLYFKSLTLAEMGNDTDLRRILSQVCDAFNEMLFGDAKPQIKRILIREFNIQ
jgi:flagellar basal body-associated protein FliL